MGKSVRAAHGLSQIQASEKQQPKEEKGRDKKRGAVNKTGLVVECYQARFLVCAGRGRDRREWASHMLCCLIAQNVATNSGAVGEDANQDIHDDRVNGLIVPNFGEKDDNRPER